MQQTQENQLIDLTTIFSFFLYCWQVSASRILVQQNMNYKKMHFFFSSFNHLVPQLLCFTACRCCVWRSSHLSPQHRDLLGHRKGFLCEKPKVLVFFVPQMHVGHVVTTSPPFSTISSTACVGVRLLPPPCATLALIVKAQYITRHLTHSPRQLLMVTECTHPAQRETLRVWDDKNSQLKSKASGPV